MSNLLQDVRFAVRSFLRAPRFTVPAVLALALGIGATSAVFSVVRGVMLKPLPYADPDRIVTIWESNAGRNRSRNVVSAANFAAWRERSRTLEHIGMVGPARFNLLLNGQPEEVTGLVASADVLAALGVQPALGRIYTPEEDLEGQDAVMLISYEFWQSRLGARQDVLGMTIVANGRPRTIVGVMPPGFTVEGARASFMVPYGWTVERLRAAMGRGASHGIARLREGVTFAQAADEMRRIAAQLEKELPELNSGWSVTLVPIHELMIEQIRPALLVLAGAVALVLLIACVNVANLLLARGTVRQRELGVRTALGAPRARLVAQMLTESLLLALVSGVAGLGLAAAFHRGLLALVADRIPIPRLDQVALDSTVLGFTLVLAVATGLLFGILPSLLATSTAIDAIREGGRHGGGPRSRRALNVLVVAEVALSLVLLAGAGLLIRSFMRLQSIDPGFRSEGVLTARVSLPAAKYNDDRAIAQFFERVIAQVRTMPGVDSAAGVSFLPMSGPGIGTSFYRLDQPVPPPGARPIAEVRPVSPGFFRTMGIPLLAGRDVSDADTGDAPQIAVVGQMLVRNLFGNENPIGKRLHVNVRSDDGMQVEIVGVVGDIKMSTLDADTRPAVYIPHPQLPIGLMTFVVRAAPSMDPSALTSGIISAVRSLDPELPVADVRAMEEVVSSTLARPRTVSVLLTAFALIALVLAGVGVYGVMAYSVSQRTQEFGVRMALGASTQSLFRMVLRQALVLVGIGIGAGLVIATMFVRVLDTLLVQTEPFDPVTFAATAIVLTLVAALASYVPARRGMRIAPMDALRAE